MHFKAGYITATGSAVDPVAFTGVGFEPKALYVFGVDGYNDGYHYDDATLGHSWAVTAGDEIGMRKRFNVDSFHSNEVGAYLAFGFATADLVSFDPDGFTLDFSSGTSWQFYYMAFGGADLEAYKGSFILPSDNSTADIVVTGVGFQPDFLITLGEGDIGGVYVDYSYGMASSPTDQACCLQQAGFGRNVQNSFQSGFIHREHGPKKAALETFDADGFTISVTDNAGSLEREVWFLALKDPGTEFKVGVETQKTSTGTKATTGVGFQPGAGLFVGTKLTSANEDDAGNVATQITWGVYDGAEAFGVVNEVCFKSAATRGCQARNVEGIVLSNSDPEAGSNPGVTLAEASLNSWDPDGFSLDWTTADSIARYFMYGVFGTSPASPFVPQIYRRA